jgi:hypothetical protein
LGSGKVSVIPNIDDKVSSKDFANIKATQISSEFTWPNKIEEIPANVFPGVNGILVPDGFLVPTHNTGNIYVLATDPSDVTKHTKTYKLAKEKRGYFYHMGRWVDLNGDGRLDLVTARSNAKAGGGELIWLEQPEGGLNTLPWKEHLITAGPDVMFELVDHPNQKDSFAVFASEFFNKELKLYEISKSNGALLNSRSIDSDIDQAYSVRYMDIDHDGREELLVNNHESNDASAAVFLYNVPEDIQEGQWTRKVIANGFKNARGMNNMCPGFPYPVYPNTAKQSGYAHILIAGDGDHSAHLLRPTGDPEEIYQKELIKNFEGTVGAITTSDVNENGWLEFYVANYDKNYVEVFEFYDADAQAEFLQ